MSNQRRRMMRTPRRWNWKTALAAVIGLAVVGAAFFVGRLTAPRPRFFTRAEAAGQRLAEARSELLRAIGNLREEVAKAGEAKNYPTGLWPVQGAWARAAEAYDKYVTAAEAWIEANRVDPRAQAPAPPPRGSRWGWILGLGGILVAAVAVILLRLRLRRRRPAPSPRQGGAGGGR